MVKASKEIARDLELAVLKNATQNRGASNTTGGEGVMGGVRFFVGGDAKEFTVVAATDVCTLTNHGFFTGDMASIYIGTNGVLPAGLTENKIYYVRAIDKDTFTLHLTSVDAQANANKVDVTSTGTAPFYISAANVIRAGGALTETMFNDMVQKIWTQGATVDSAVMSGKRKREISSWTAGTTKNRNQGEKKLTTVIDVLETDFGIVNLEAHRMQDDDRIDFFEYQYWKLAYLKPFHVEDVPRKGTYTEKVIDGMVTLECKSPQSQGAIIGITG